ncbi:hypothetical protein SCLCIDRAFT_938085 [Scleroderma citrinum Foug A]|uniref:Uncharacterized protein n=1 Tax=Scleroderma citrinum Foug A TaxID=1036808 RepID=A0A0C3DIY0_9AGAM|nr:hypothetical protein SCLCIDRAFT_938085 [Scleroderma citrinum Foug A]
MSSVTIIIVSFLYVLYVVLMESRSGFSGTAMPVILSTSLRMWAYLSAGVFMIVRQGDPQQTISDHPRVTYLP